MMRGVKNDNLEGLRKRIATLFFHYIKTPLFNAEVARHLKVLNFFLYCFLKILRCDIVNAKFALTLYLGSRCKTILLWNLFWMIIFCVDELNLFICLCVCSISYLEFFPNIWTKFLVKYCTILNISSPLTPSCFCTHYCFHLECCPPPSPNQVVIHFLRLNSHVPPSWGFTDPCISETLHAPGLCSLRILIHVAIL